MEKNEDMMAKIEGRYVEGDREIRSVPVVPVEEVKDKKSFGGKGGPSGRKEKGVKNAKVSRSHTSPGPPHVTDKAVWCFGRG
jgi:hypothetical protein